MKQYTKEQQNLIDGIEFAIDYGLEISEEDYKEYCKLTEQLKEREQEMTRDGLKIDGGR